VSDTTIRDVLIKVSVVNGEMKLAAPDTSSIMDAIKQVQAEAAKIKLPIFDTSAIQQLKQIGQDLKAAQSQQASPQRAGTSPLKGNLSDIFGIDIDQSGGSSHDVPDWMYGIAGGNTSLNRRSGGRRSASDPFGLSPEERAMTKSAGKIQRERAAAAKAADAERAAADKAQERDRDRMAQEGLRSYSKIMRERKAAQEKEEAQHKTQTGARIQLAKGAAQFAASASGNEKMMHAVVAAEGLSNLASSAAAAGLAMNPLTIGIAALAAGVVLAAKAMSEAVERIQIGLRATSAKALVEHHAVSQGVLRQFENQNTLANIRPYTGNLANNLKAFDASQKREARIREFEASAASPEMKARFRERTERQGGFEDERRETESQLAFHRNKLRNQERAHRGLVNDLPGVVESRKKAVAAAENRVKHSQDESSLGSIGRNLYRAGTGELELYGFNTGIDQKTGLWQGQAQNKREAEIALGEAKKQGWEAEKQANEAITESLKQQQAEKAKIAELSTKNLYTTKAEQQAAYQAVHAERQRVQSARISFGGASAGDRMLALNIQAKHKRIEAQRAENKKNNRPEDEGIEEYSQHELDAPSFGGLEEKTKRQQKERRAKAEGYEIESDLDSLEEENKEQQARKVKPQRDQAGQDAFDADKAADEIGEAFKRNFPLKEIIAAIDKRGAELKIEMEEAAQKNKMTFGPGG